MGFDEIDGGLRWRSAVTHSPITLARQLLSQSALLAVQATRLQNAVESTE